MRIGAIALLLVGCGGAADVNWPAGDAGGASDAPGEAATVQHPDAGAVASDAAPAVDADPGPDAGLALGAACAGVSYPSSGDPSTGLQKATGGCAWPIENPYECLAPVLDGDQSIDPRVANVCTFACSVHDGQDWSHVCTDAGNLCVHGYTKCLDNGQTYPNCAHPWDVNVCVKP